MKKIIAFACVLLMSLSLFACADTAKEDLNVYMPEGATALALAYMMENHKTIDGKNVNYNVIQPEFISGYIKNESADIALLPANAAISLYNAGAKYKIASVMTHGNLFIIGTDTLADLDGKVVASIGEGAIPQMVFEHILDYNGLNVRKAEKANDAKDGFVSILFVGEGSDVIAALNTNKADYGLIAEPAATNALNNPNVSIGKKTINIQDEWKAATGMDGYPQAVLFVKDGTDNSVVAAFLSACESAGEWAENNHQAAVNAINSHAIRGAEGTMPNVAGKEVVARCNIRSMTSGLKEYVESFLQAVGATNIKPNSGIYYGI